MRKIFHNPETDDAGCTLPSQGTQFLTMLVGSFPWIILVCNLDEMNFCPNKPMYLKTGQLAILGGVGHVVVAYFISRYIHGLQHRGAFYINLVGYLGSQYALVASLSTKACIEPNFILIPLILMSLTVVICACLVTRGKQEEANVRGSDPFFL